MQENNLEEKELSAEEIDTPPEPLLKPKRERSEKQKEALEKARKARSEKKLKERKDKEELDREAEKIVLKKKSK